MTRSNDPTDLTDLKARLARAIVAHVPFDGFGPVAFAAAAADIGVPIEDARAACRRGGIDLAHELHRQGDAELIRRAPGEGLSALRYSERVARLIRLRIDLAGDREVVRRSSALYALPLHAAEGAQLIWGTADAIWTALGDTSRDVNWYSKRAILSGVYGSSVLYWLGDQSPGAVATEAFIERRIADVMRFEKFKADMRNSKLFSPFVQGLERLTAGIRAPAEDWRAHLPGTLTPKEH